MCVCAYLHRHVHGSCMCTGMSVHVCSRVPVCVYVHICIGMVFGSCTCTGVYVCRHACVYAHLHRHVCGSCMCTGVYVCMCAGMCMCVHVPCLMLQANFTLLVMGRDVSSLLTNTVHIHVCGRWRTASGASLRESSTLGFFFLSVFWFGFLLLLFILFHFEDRPVSTSLVLDSKLVHTIMPIAGLQACSRHCSQCFLCMFW